MAASDRNINIPNLIQKSKTNELTKKVKFIPWDSVKFEKKVNFCYSDIEDFDIEIVTSLWKNIGDLLLMKARSLC